MKLPPDTNIPEEKLTHYLLVPRTKSDKSRWLALGGYHRENSQRLAADLRTQILPLDAIPSRSSSFGDSFEICGQLIGPSGIPISVRTIWIKDALSGAFRFVTLIPLSTPRA